jgi:hypothetical protein
MVMMAILFAVLLAIAGLVLDGGHIYFEKRHMQAAADAGAYGGAHELRRGSRPGLDVETAILQGGRYDAELNGYEHGKGSIDVTVNHPPASGPNSGSMNHVEVIIMRTVPTYFMRILNIDAATVRARAVAGLETNGEACVLALDPEDRASLRVAGTPELRADCGLMVNSRDDRALQANGGGTIEASWAGVYGGYELNGGGSITPTPQEGALPMIDPLSYVAPPDPNGVVPVYNNVHVNNSVAVLNPGRYRGGLRISGSGADVTFNAGLYVLDSGMDVTGGRIRGNGVTFYNTGNQLITIAGAADVELTAPTDGPYQGMLFWGDVNSPDRNPGHRFRGTSSSSFAGAIYFPSQHVDWAGNNETIGEWTMLVANTIDITGTAAVVQIHGPPPGVLPELTTVTMVE